MKLNNNYILPSVGYGTWKLKNDEITVEIIMNALEVGYKLFDTAYAYGNEEAIGRGLKKSNIARNEIYISGKLWNDDRGYDNIIEACKRTIKNLDCDYLDLYLIHWPASKALYNNWNEINDETWKAFEYLYESKLVKAIGVCNFNINQLEKLITNAKIKPMVNQIELHPGLLQKDVLEYCKVNNILIQAWSPLGSGKILKNEELCKIADKYQRSISQICIKWCLQNGCLPIPKAKNKEHMIENLNVDNFLISDEDMNIINNMPFIGGYNFDSENITLFN